MASHVQSAGTTFDNVTNFTYAVPVNPVAGDLVVLGAARFRSGDSTIYQSGSLTQSAGTATISLPTLLEGSAAGNVVFAFWTFLVTGSGSLTLQIAHGGAGTFGSLFLAEFSGNFLNQRDINYSANSGASVAPDTGNITTHRIGDTVIVAQVVGLHSSNVTITEDAAWSLVGEDETASTRVAHSLIYRIVPRETTDSGSWTFGASGSWAAVVMGFSEGGEFPSRMIV